MTEFAHPTPAGTDWRTETMAIQAGRNPQAFDGLVNTPVCRGSTILASSLEEWEARKLPNNPYASYGRFGTATTRALESSVARLEGGHASLVFPSGLAACAHALLAVVRSGDHVLITDSVYGPTRHFATHVLSRLGVEVEFYGPHETTGLRSRLRRNTRLVFVESPGSLTFEIQDIGAIAEQARTVGALVIMDNTWATPLFFKPFEHGVDISIQSATKYLIGHSDALLGVATANARAWDRLREGAHDLGQTAGPDDIFLALRGIRSLGVRLRQHESNGIALAHALRAHPMVRRVLHPALPDDPGHRLWRRDFLGASGLFAIELQPVGQAQLSTLFSRLQLFGIGLSWGGYESLALPVGTPTRSVSQPALEGPLIRIHAGLENIQDLIDDFSQALSAARLALS